MDRAVAEPNPSPELIATAAKYHLLMKQDVQKHYEIAKSYALRSLDAGLGHQELQSVIPRNKLLNEPEIEKESQRKPNIRRVQREPNFVDPWTEME
ncbi:MAG: hypothetical protein QM811_08495 [Pirellulales bacterium]